jgi:hypothetical protein
MDGDYDQFMKELVARVLNANPAEVTNCITVAYLATAGRQLAAGSTYIGESSAKSVFIDVLGYPRLKRLFTVRKWRREIEDAVRNYLHCDKVNVRFGPVLKALWD